MIRLLIGLSGDTGSGKDTAADTLIDSLEYDYGILSQKIRFFCGGKESLSVLTDWPLSYFEDRKYKEEIIEPYGVSPRYMMEKYGTEFVRECLGQDFWIKKLNQKVSGLSEEIYIVFIPDVRFDNEEKYIRDNGGLLVHMSRPDNPLKIPSTHVSNALAGQCLGDLFIVANDLLELQIKCFSATVTLVSILKERYRNVIQD